MANNRYGYMARIGADTSGLKAGLQEADSALQRTQRELNAVNRSIRDAEAAGVSSATAVAQKRELLNQEIEQTRRKLNDLLSVEQQMRQAADRGTISAEQYRQYQREIQNTQTSLARYQNQLLQTQQAEQDSAGANQIVVTSLSDVQNALNKVVGDLDWFVGKIKEVSGAALTYSKRMTKYALDVGQSFESSMSQVKAYSGAVGDDFTALEDAAKDAGATTSKSATEAADALGYMALAGWDTREMLDGLMPIIKASEAGSADLKRTSDLVTDSMSAMGVATSDLTHYLDVCTAAQSNSNTTLTGLLEAYVNCGGTLRNLNVPLEESATLLGLLANRGTKASEAGTSLNSILVNLMGANKSAKAAMDKLGISAWDAQGNFKGVTETLRLLDGALENCTEQQKNFLEAKIGGKTQMDTLQKLIAGVREEYNDLYTTLENSQGALEQTSDTMHDNLAGSLTTMRSALEALGVEFYDYLEEPAREAVDAVTDALRKLTSSVDKGELSAHLKELSEKTGELIEKLVKFASDKGIDLVIDGLSDLIDVLSWCADNTDKLAAAAKGLGAAFLTIKIGTLATDIMVLVGTITTLEGAAAAGSVAATALSTALNAIPFVAIAAAAIGAATALASWIRSAGDAKAESDALISGTTELTDAITEQTAALREQLDAFDDEKKKISENSEACRYWWGILQNVTDEQGNVNGELDTAQTAVEALNQIMGTHIELLDGQIQGYTDLAGSIDEYIKTVEKQAQIDYLKDDYAKATLELPKVNEEFTAVKEQYDTFSPLYDSAMKAISEQKGRSSLKRDYGQLYMLMNQVGLNPADYVSSITGVLDLDKVKKAFDDKNRDLSMQYLGLSEQIRQYNGIIDQYTALETELLTSQTESTVSTSAPSPTVTYHDDTAEKEAGAKQHGNDIKRREKELKRALNAIDGIASTDEYYAALARILAEYSDIAYTDTYKDAKKKLDKHDQSKSGGASGGGSSGSKTKETTWKDEMQSELDAEDLRYYQSGEKDEEQHLKNRLAIVEKYRQENEIAWWNVYNSEKNALDKFNADLEESEKKQLNSAIDSVGTVTGAVAGLIEKRKEAAAKAAADALDELTYSEGDDLDKYLSDINDTVSYWAEQGVDITEEAAVKKTEAEQKEYDARLKNAADFAQKISEEQKRRAENMLGGDLTSEAESPTGEKIAYFDDLSERAKQISKYIENYKKLQELGLPNDLLNEIESMSFKDKAAAVAELVKMNPQKRDLYVSDYTALKAKQAEAAAMETEDDVQAAMADIFADVPDSVYQSGKDAADKYIQGIMDEFSEKGITIDPAILGNYSYNANRTDGGTGAASAAERQAQSADKMTDASEKQVQSADKISDASEKQVQSAGMMTDAASAWSAAVDKFNAAVQSIPDTIRIDAVSGKTPITINVAGKDVIRTTVGELMRTSRITDA